MDLEAVLGKAVQPGFLKAELLLDHPERMLNFDQIEGFEDSGRVVSAEEEAQVLAGV